MKNHKKNLQRRHSLWLVLSIAFIFCMDCSTRSVRYFAPPEINNLTETTSIMVELNDGSQVTMTQPQIKDGKLIDLAIKSSTMEKNGIEISKIKLVKVVKRGSVQFSFIPAAIAAVWLVIGAMTAPKPPPAKSCPFIYSWDGRQYIFEAEPYGGAICRGLQRSEWCRLDWLQSVDHFYRLRIANELDESEFTDEAKLLVVDHPPGLRIAADINGGLHTFGNCRMPLSARDENGRDINPLLTARDSLFWESDISAMDPGQEENLRHELNFTFPKPLGAKQAKLLVNAWTSLWGAQVPKMFLQALGRDLGGFYEEVNAFGPAWRKIMGWFLNEELYLLRIQVKTASGWQSRGYLQGGGPFMANDKAYVIDISDVPGSTLELRLCPPVTFWRFNYLAIDYSPDLTLQVQELAPQRAVNQDGLDVTQELSASDGNFLILPGAGKWAEVFFVEPSRRENLTRSFILKINGYYDIHMVGQGDPQPELVDRFFNDPGFTIRYALRAYLKQLQQKR